MKTDIDRLMAESDLDAIVVMGDETPNTYRDYLTNRARADGTLIKKRGEVPVYIVSSMEIDEAAKSGLTIRTDFDFGLAELNAQYRADVHAIRREKFLNYFRKLGITGRVGFYGVAEIGKTLECLFALQDSALNVQIVVDGPDIFSAAYETKDAQEIEALRETARLTAQVVRRTWDFLSEHYTSSDAADSPVVDAQGRPLTIGAVKQFIRMQEFALGLEDPMGCIFAQGRDAGMPHSHGEDDDVLVVGRSIVFDIFPRSLKTGYYHDMTRTWCLGYATQEVQQAYDEVMTIFREVLRALKVGEQCSVYQQMTLDFFEARGHPTQRSAPGTLAGYVHSLAHGLGLNVHEAPYFREYGENVTAPGNVFTVEPGLYYPERGFGVRIEDTVYFDPEGRLHTLTAFPYDLVLPLRTGRP